MCVRRTDRDQCHIDREDPLTEQPGHLAQENGNVIRSARGNRFPHVAADEACVVVKPDGQLRRHIGGAALSVDVNEFHPRQILSRTQRLDQRRRRHRHAVDEHPVI